VKVTVSDSSSFIRHGAIQQVGDLSGDPRDMYRSWVMETLGCPKWSAPIRAESPRVVDEHCHGLAEVGATSGRASRAGSRTARHAVVKFSGSQSVPLLDAKIACC
jgi:hypothetical protein